MTGYPLRQARQPAFLVPVCPTSLLAFMVIMSLLLVQMLGAIAALGFLLAGVLLVVRRPKTMLVEIERYWFVLLIPFWCLLSVLWSNYPGITLRGAVQLLVTFGIAISIASRLSPLNFLRVLFLAHATAGLLSVAIGRVRDDGGAWLGIYGSKNAFAAVMSLLVLTSFALAADKRQSPLWRLAGLGGLALGGVLLLRADSAGATLATCFALVFGCIIFAARWLSPLQRMIAASLSVLAIIFVALTLFSWQDELFALLLEKTGKDATLTGRTDLWMRAVVEIREHPLLGQGFLAVWVEGNPIAEELWREFGIKTKRGFHFHNTYISNTVEIGLIGIALQAAGLLGAAWLTLTWALRDPRAETVFLAILMLRVTMLSMVEVAGFMPFDLGTLMIVAALVFGWRARAAARTVTLPRPQAGTAPMPTPWPDPGPVGQTSAP